MGNRFLFYILSFENVSLQSLYAYIPTQKWHRYVGIQYSYILTEDLQ